MNRIVETNANSELPPLRLMQGDERETTAPACGRILLADDNEALLGGLSAILSALGHQVACATDSASAADLLLNSSFDVVIADVGSAGAPGMDGMALLRLIREMDLDVPVVLITGNPTVDTAVRALDQNVLQYLVKPFDSAMLQRTIQKALDVGAKSAQQSRTASKLAKLGNHIGENAVLALKLESALRDIYQVKPLDSAGLQQAVRRALNLHQSMKHHRTAMENIVEHKTRIADAIELDAKLDSALRTMWMAYQPIICRSDHNVLGYEALLRSTEPALPDPGAVLSAAERLGRMHDVGRRTRGLVAATLDDNAGITVFVNLSVSDLLDEALYSATAPLTLHASRVVFEITERASLDKVEDLTQRMDRLRRLGFRIALDDLGAGYAGLTSLLLLEPDFVKIDMALVRNVHQSPNKQLLIRSVIELCREMGMRFVAEGVETREENDALAGMNCDLYQGYFFAKPGKPFPSVSF